MGGSTDMSVEVAPSTNPPAPRERKFQVVPVAGAFSRGRWRCVDFPDSRPPAELLDALAKLEGGGPHVFTADFVPNGSDEADIIEDGRVPTNESSTIVVTSILPQPPTPQHATQQERVETTPTGYVPSQPTIPQGKPIPPPHFVDSPDSQAQQPLDNASFIGTPLPSLIQQQHQQTPSTPGATVIFVPDSTIIPPPRDNDDNQSASVVVCSITSSTTLSSGVVSTPVTPTTPITTLFDTPSLFVVQNAESSSSMPNTTTPIAPPTFEILSQVDLAPSPQIITQTEEYIKATSVLGTPGPAVQQQSSATILASVASEFVVSASAETPLDDEQSTSAVNVVAIDNKIEQAMDLVKTHLTFAVREEVEMLRNTIADLEAKVASLESQNAFMRQFVPAEVVANLPALIAQQKAAQAASAPASSVAPPLERTFTLQGPEIPPEFQNCPFESTLNNVVAEVRNAVSGGHFALGQPPRKNAGGALGQQPQ